MPAMLASTSMLTPCTGVCRLDADGRCEGCHRDSEEIACWTSYSDEHRRYLMDEVLPSRAGSRS